MFPYFLLAWGREGGREHPTTTRRGSVVWMRLWRYLIVPPWRYCTTVYMQVVVKIVKVVKIQVDRYMGVCT